MDLADGRHGALVAELTQLTAQFPLRESLWARLLVALDRCGRQAEAVARYETIRVRIADELGVKPGPELQHIHGEAVPSFRRNSSPGCPRGCPSCRRAFPRPV
jgi:DNA-binding SARP family transcriptional activator